MTTLAAPHLGMSLPIGRLRTLLRYRELIWMLAWRDIRVRYKHSVLGAAWAVLPPLAMMLIFTFVFGTVTDINRQSLTGHPTLAYPLFAFSGLVPWMFLANGLSSATGSLVANRQLVTKIYFPREVFPISAIMSAFVDFVIAFALLVLMIVFIHVQSPVWEFRFHWAILLLPVVVAVQICFMVGLGLILSMANLFYRDVSFLFRSVVQLWMFVTCVIYQLQATDGWKRVAIQLNPMTPIIQAYRDCLLNGRSPLNTPFIATAAFSVGLLLLGWSWFLRRESDFAENI